MKGVMKNKAKKHQPGPSSSDKAKATFPKVSLEKSLTLAYAIKEKNGGNPWLSEQAADAVGYAPKTSNFFYLGAASRDFGLTKGGRDTEKVELQPLGREIVYAPDAQTENAKKREAFLKIELFKKVLEHYKGSKLPEMKYLANTLENEFGLPPDKHEEFSQLFRENCKYLGIETGFTSESKNGVTDLSIKQQVIDGPLTVTLAEPATQTGVTAFVIMPFVEKEAGHLPGFFQEVLRNLITPAAREAGFVVKTANRQGSDIIQSTIINDLLEADLVIADLTEHNPNVLFELGIRMAQQKPVALIKSTGTGRIFDVDNLLRVYEYQSTLWASSVQKDLPALTEHIKGTWDSRATGATYMSILLHRSSAVAGGAGS